MDTAESDAATHRPLTPSVAATRGGTLLVLRIVLVGAATVLAWAVIALPAGAPGFPPSSLVAGVGLLAANVVSLLVVRRMLHAEGRRVRDAFGFRRGRILRDIAWGLLWVVVTSVPFMLAIMGVMWALHGERMLTAFETVFADPTTLPDWPPVVGLTLGIVFVVTFAPLNAPTEELVYRGYAQSHLAARWPAWAAIVVTAAAFGVQHAFFAAGGMQAVLVFVAAFFAWGLCAGIIVHFQRRLGPITIAHVFINLFGSAPAIVLPILQLTGVV